MIYLADACQIWREQGQVHAWVLVLVLQEQNCIFMAGHSKAYSIS